MNEDTNLVEKLRENEIVDDWLESVKDSTAQQYGYRFKQFLDHFGITPDQFLEEAQNKKIKVKTKINKWYKHQEKQGHSANYRLLANSAIRSFLRFYEIDIKRQRKERARKYRRKAMRKDDIKAMIHAAPHLRDKALMILAFQTGMSVADLLKLNYDHVKTALETDSSCGIIYYTRGKEGTEAVTVFGNDSIKILKDYIAWRKERGDELEDDTPLFTGVHKSADKRLTIRAAQNMIRLVAVKSGLIKFKELEKYTKFNPAGFHAIRKAFSSVAKINGMPSEQAELSMGHSLKYGGAYEEFTEEELIENFKTVETELSIFSEEREIKKHTDQLEDQDRVMTSLKAEIEELKAFKKFMEGFVP